MRFLPLDNIGMKMSIVFYENAYYNEKRRVKL